MVTTPRPVSSITIISSLSSVFNPERPATITAPALVGFSAPTTSSITNSQGKGKGILTTKPTCFSATVFLATTARGDTTPRPTAVYILFQHHRQRVS